MMATAASSSTQHAFGTASGRSKAMKSRRNTSGWRTYTPTPRESVSPLAKRTGPDSTGWMIRPGFMETASRQNLMELARDGSAAQRRARRANALVLLDYGMSCAAVAKVLLHDDITIRTWHQLYEKEGIEGLASFGPTSTVPLGDFSQASDFAWGD